MSLRSEDLSFFESKDFKESLEQYESALKEGRKVYMDADELTDISEYYMVNEREEDASKCISLALELHPDATNPQVFLARQQMFHNNLEKAREIAQAIQQQDDRETRFLWAEIFIREGDSYNASDMLMQHYLTLQDGQAQFLYDSANIFADYDEWEIALEWATKLKEEFPKYKNTNMLLSDAMLSCGKVQEAEKILQEILSNDPFCKEGWRLMAEAQSSQKRYNDALESIDYMLALDENDSKGILIRANCLFHLNRIQETHEEYVKYLKQVPNDITILYFDSVALTHLKQYDEAMDQLRKAMSYCKKDSTEFRQICMQSCYLLSKTSMYENALTVLEEAYQIGNTEKDADYYLLKGHIMLETQNTDEAEECFEKALTCSDDATATTLTTAIEYAENELYEKAIYMLETLMKTDMPDKEARCMPYLAYCTYFVPEHGDHKKYLRQAAQCNPILTEYLFAPIYPGKSISEYGEI